LKYGPSDIPESERNANVVTRHINRRDNGVMRSSKVMPMLWTWWNDDDMRTVPMDTALGNMSDNDFYSVEVPSTTSSASHRTWELVAYKSNVSCPKHTSLYRLARIRSIK
jgi:hypothetical protein